MVKLAKQQGLEVREGEEVASITRAQPGKVNMLSSAANLPYAASAAAIPTMISSSTSNRALFEDL